MKKSLVFILLIGLLGACTLSQGSPFPTPSNTFLPPTTTLTSTPIPPTPTITPIAPLAEEGPWLAFGPAAGSPRKGYELVLTNLDGSGNHLVDLPKLYEPIQISASGDLAAVRIITADKEPRKQAQFAGIWIISLPDGEVIRRIRLLGEQAQTWLTEHPPTEFQGLVTTVLGAPFLWSPDGRYLAFSGALDGESSDLYLYDAVEDRVSQLTDGSKQAVVHSWSPDSRWVLHEAAMFYRPQNRVIYSTWAASVEGQINRLEYGPFNQHPIIGWLSSDLLLTYTRRSLGASEELRTVDLQTGRTEFLFNDPFVEAAFDPTSRTILLNLQPVDFASADSLPGIYKLDADSGLLEMVLPGDFGSLSWQTPLAIFTAVENHTRMIFFDQDGKQHCSLNTRPGDVISYSPDEIWMVVSNSERSIVSSLTCEPILELDRPGKMFWLPDSSGFYTYIQNAPDTYAVSRYLTENAWEAEPIRERIKISGSPILIAP